jgi:inner membrane protein
MAMDTFTQIALGAALGEAVLGRRVGRRALFWGGLSALLPDLDVMIPYADAVKSFTYHRSFSHSIFVLTLLTPIVVWLILKVHPDTRLYRRGWYKLVFLAFATHSLLDCLTVYGTQILWPLPTPPIMWSSVFIIDPAYSIPLFVGVTASAIASRKMGRSYRVNTICLALSTLYLAWSLGAKTYVDQTAKLFLARQNISYQIILSVPTAFNTVLWRVIVVEDEGYYEGFYSLLDKDRTIRFNHYPSNKMKLECLADHWPIKRLQWFTQGFYAIDQLNGDVIFTDLRMGMQSQYFFRFKVAEAGNPHPVATKAKRISSQRDAGQLVWIWNRIWGSNTLDGSRTLNGNI